MKLCVFQGTFNPIHNAHLRIAKVVKETFNYDKILFIPAYKPPHKEFDENFSNHRLEMVKLAIKEYDGFEVSNIEYLREGLSYTYLTICELYKQYKIKDKIGFIIGTDAFIYLPEWYETEKLKELINFILFKRSDTIDKNRLAILSKKGYKFNMMDTEFLDISSTKIREKIMVGESVENLLPKRVLEYIEKYELYRK
jgi:nicotinate-nucleotide adenylyltransferase